MTFRKRLALLLALCLTASLALGQGTVVAWGDNDYGQTDVPPGLTDVVAISAGLHHCLALKADGTVVAWGDNTYGQTDVPVGLSGVVAISAGYRHSLALKSDGSVIAWGNNTYSQSTVPAGLTGVVAVAAGGYHSLVLKSDGTLAAWGYNGENRATIPAGLSGVASIAAGGFHNAVAKQDGTVVAWGSNAFGQTDVPPGLAEVGEVAAGSWTNLALKEDGSVTAWGGENLGTPSLVVPAGLAANAVAAGYDHCLALKADGTVVAWGSNSNSQTLVPEDLSGVAAIAAGGNCSLALVASNRPPFADAGSDRSVASNGELTDVTLYGSGSFDPDSDDLRFEWRDETGVLVATDSTPVLSLPSGMHGFTLRVFDDHGHFAWDFVRITVAPHLLSFVLAQPKVVGGFALKATATLNGAAAAATLVAISSDTPNKVTGPGLVTVKGGASTTKFSLKTYTVLSETVCSVTASCGGVSRTATLTLKVGGLQSFKANPATLAGGSATVGTVLLSGAAPAGSGGRTIYLTSKDPALVHVPATVVVPEGAVSATFPITTSSVGAQATVRVIAKLGVVTKQAEITLNP